MSNKVWVATGFLALAAVLATAPGYAGGVLVQAFSVTGGTPSAADNDYLRIKNAIVVAPSSQLVQLQGSFNWTEPFAAAAWALGNDGVAGNADDFSILVPPNRNSITLRAAFLGDATITGPGDLATQNLEGVLVFDGGDNQNWRIENLRILDFDLAIGMFNGAGGSDAYSGTTIENNLIRIPADLNAVVAPADVNQNIGLHYSFGINQTIRNNGFELPGSGVGSGATLPSSVVMQSNISGGAIYNGLLIEGNEIRILGPQSANPETILGIWENGVAHTSTVTVRGNRFLNLGAGNDAALNRQRAFRVTSHSSATTTVRYTGNRIEAANVGFEWLTGNNFAGNQPVQLSENVVLGTPTGVRVQSSGLANATCNRFDGNTTGIQLVTGSATALDNWWGCNAGPGVGLCDGVAGFANPTRWLVLSIGASPSTITVGGTSTVTASLGLTSAGGNVSCPTPTGFANTATTFGASSGSILPVVTSMTSSTAGVSATYTASGSSGPITVTATVDTETVGTTVTVRPDPFFVNGFET